MTKEAIERQQALVRDHHAITNDQRFRGKQSAPVVLGKPQQKADPEKKDK